MEGCRPFALDANHSNQLVLDTGCNRNKRENAGGFGVGTCLLSREQLLVVTIRGYECRTENLAAALLSKPELTRTRKKEEGGRKDELVVKFRTLHPAPSRG